MTNLTWPAFAVAVFVLNDRAPFGSALSATELTPAVVVVGVVVVVDEELLLLLRPQPAATSAEPATRIIRSLLVASIPFPSGSSPARDDDGTSPILPGSRSQGRHVHRLRDQHVDAALRAAADAAV